MFDSTAKFLSIAISNIQSGNLLEAKSILQNISIYDNYYPDALRFLSILYSLDGDHQEALSLINKVLELIPNNGIAYSNKGNILRKLGDTEGAFIAYETAIQHNPNYSEAYNNLGNLYQECKQFDDAINQYQKSIKVDPNYSNAYMNMANALLKIKSYQDAYVNYHKALSLNPHEKFLLGNYLHTKMLLCDWHDLDQLYSQIEQGLHAGQKVADPFGFQGISTSEADLQACAQLMAEDYYPSLNPITANSITYNNPKIRLGYLCGEFRHQATSILMTGVYELHDKNRFEIFAFDNGWDDASELRHRIKNAFIQVIDINKLTDEAAAKLIADMKIDILINLNGYFGDGRQNIFAHRAAPIQVNYLGFPGTMGAPYMDYLIADKTIIPPDRQQFYTEKIIYLPHCYQPNDSKRAIADRQFTRQELDLPENSFIFCCFNNNYKITPKTFDSWMRILSKIEGSALWLLEDNPTAAQNLRNEAQARGIAPDRLIFAPRMSLPEHLARHRQADLFLDTLPCNAHTTASDALWAGLPLLTCYGTTFAGRVAASLLKAIDTPELITYTYEEYEKLAIELALNPAQLKKIREKITNNRDTSPLFDTQGFTQALENVYLEMYSQADGERSKLLITT